MSTHIAAKMLMLGCYLCLVSCCFCLAATNQADPKKQVIEYRNPVAHQITQSISVTNVDVSPLGYLELNLPIPLNWDAQTVASITIKGDSPFRLRDTNHLARIVRSVYKKETRPIPGETRTLSISYTLTCQEAVAPKDFLARQFPFKDYRIKSRDYKLFTSAEQSIEVDSKKIREAADRIRGSGQDALTYAKEVYQYVIDHTEYVSPSPSRSALECLERGQGDCGAYSMLFVALCRAGGVPARSVVGCWAIGENQWHCWAEFYLPNAGWVPVDPTAASTNPPVKDYYFGNMDNNRVILAKTWNCEVKSKIGSTKVGGIQVGTWWWWPAPGNRGSKMTVDHRFLGRRLEGGNMLAELQHLLHRQVTSRKAGGNAEKRAK